MARISEFSERAPFEAEYIECSEILGMPIRIADVASFENKKGKGIHALIVLEDGTERRICTHGVAVVDVLSRSEVANALKAGELIECKLVMQPSETNRDRKVLKLVDA